MKKFFFTLFILIIIGGVGFFFGWVQFKVPPGQYGVIHSKTHGVDPELVRSGEFRWIWYKLIPTNVQVSVFRIGNAKFSINYNNTLPSGSAYASFAGLSNVDFSWNFKGEVSFSISPDSLVELVKKHKFTGQEDLEEYMGKIANDIEVIILRSLSSTSDGSTQLEQFLTGYPETLLYIQIKEEVSNRFPEIRDFSFIIHSVKYPDFILYRQLKLMYEEFLSRQREYVSSSFARRAETHIESQMRFEELQRIGDLLTRFPILLEYIKIEER